jgi:uncharacterized protein (TIRG00374 family)
MMGMVARTFIVRVVLYAIKVSIAFALLYWLYRQGVLDFTVLLALTIDARFVGASVIACGLVAGALILISLRLVLVLRLQGISLSPGRSIGLTMIGALFGFVLPGLIAGDAVKVMYLLRGSEGRKSKAVAAVIADRLIGMYGLFILGSIASVAAWAGGWIQEEMYPILLIAPLLTFTGAVILAVFIMLDYGSGTLSHRVISWLPRIVRNLMFALTDYSKHGASIFQTMGISVLSHGLIVLAFFVMAMLIHDPLKLAQHLTLDPLAMVLNIVPLTPGGLGLTEGAFAYLFQHAGSPNGAIIALLGRLMQYLVFSIGGSIALVAIRLQPKGSSQQIAKQEGAA